MSAWRSGERGVPSRDDRGRARGGPAQMDDGTEGQVDPERGIGETQQAGQSVLLPLAVGVVFLIVLVLGAMVG
jgi:hypothetical protein